MRVSWAVYCYVVTKLAWESLICEVSPKVLRTKVAVLPFVGVATMDEEREERD